jgi:flagellar basal body-associated protein FliL
MPKRKTKAKEADDDQANDDQTKDNQDAAEEPAAEGTKKNHIALYIIMGIVIVLLIIGGLLLISSSGALSSSTTTVPQSNTPPVYMNASAVQLLLGATIINPTANYSTSSIYNLSSPDNITLLESVVPALTGNATNGWVTVAVGSGSNNASIQYYVVQTANAPSMSALLAQAAASSFMTLPRISYGMYNGLNYTYEAYSNSTGSFQNLVGWKHDYVSLVQIEANNFVSNQTAISETVSNNIP